MIQTISIGVEELSRLLTSYRQGWAEREFFRKANEHREEELHRANKEIFRLRSEGDDLRKALVELKGSE
jgi:hypothetical protein